MPAEYAAVSFDLVVRATEIGADQQPGLSTTATLRVTVFSAASAWLMMDHVLSGPSFGESFVAREAIDALLSGAPNTSGPSLRFAPVSMSALIGSDEGLLGLELGVSGSGGRPVVPNEEIDGGENAEENSSDSEKPKADSLDSQVLSVPAISGEEPHETELAELETDSEAPSDADLAELAQAVDAAIEDLNAEEESDSEA
ncbi:MAG: hypothetical protein U9N87_10545 [Planctomycetota bacterium]|nr:hypothetical protein [Planctomycetota bacterium]